MKTLLRFVTVGRFPNYACELDRVYSHHALQLIDGGGISLRIGDLEYTLTEAAYVWYAPPGVRIAFHPAPGYAWWSHRYICVIGELADEWMQVGLFPREPQSLEDAGDVITRFDALISTIQQPNYWDRWKVRNGLEALLINLAEQRQDSPRESDWFNELLDELEGLDGQRVNYEQLAQQHGTSYRTLRREFRMRMGISLHQYFVHRRLALACELLKTTSLPLKAIADRLGYCDVASFSNQFSHHLFLTPGSFRKQRVNIEEQ